MENGSDTHIEKKEVLMKRMTTVYALLGFATAPVVFILAWPDVGFLMPWLRTDDLAEAHIGLTFWVPIVTGIAWSVFAGIGWRRGNVGIRMGLTAVVWALVAAVVGIVMARVLVEAL